MTGKLIEADRALDAPEHQMVARPDEVDTCGQAQSSVEPADVRRDRPGSAVEELAELLGQARAQSGKPRGRPVP